MENDRQGRAAATGGETVSAVLARELRDLVSLHADWLSREVPGFAEALAWRRFRS